MSFREKSILIIEIPRFSSPNITICINMPGRSGALILIFSNCLSLSLF
jgi:hypothetical protein